MTGLRFHDRIGGSVALAVSAPLLIAGHLANVGSSGEFGTVTGAMLRFGAHTLLILGFVAVYAAQAHKPSLLNRLGMILGVLGTAMISSVLLIEIGGSAGENVTPLLEASPVASIVLLAGMTWFIGVILLAIAIIRLRVLPVWAGAILLIGNLTFGVGTMAGSAEQLLTIIGSALTAVALAWLGVALFRGSREIAPALA